MKTTARSATTANEEPEVATWPDVGPVHGPRGLKYMTDGSLNPDWPENLTAKADARAAKVKASRRKAS